MSDDSPASWDGNIFASYGNISRTDGRPPKKVFGGGEGLSLGMLINAIVLPIEPEGGFPQWAVTTTKRLKDLMIADSRIREILYDMELARRKRVRAEIGPNIPVTEFDEHLADLLKRFK